MELAAGTIAVASIAFQLADQIRKLCNFWDAYTDAPEHIRSIVKDLNLLSSVLNQIRQDELLYGLDSATREVLESCEDYVATCVGIVDSFSVGLESQSQGTRRWSAVKAVFKNEKIKKFRDLLQSIKFTLVLAQQNQANRMAQVRHDSYSDSLSTISRGIAGLRTQYSSEPVRTTSTASQPDIADHLEALHAEARRVASPILYPVIREAVTSALNHALEQTAVKMQASLGSGAVASCRGGKTGSGSLNPRPHRAGKVGSSGDLRKTRSKATSGPRTQAIDENDAADTGNTQGDEWFPDTTKSGQDIIQRYQDQQWYKCLTNHSSDIIETVFGTVVSRWETWAFHSKNDDRNRDYVEPGKYVEQTTTFRIHPAQWILRLGFSYGFQWTILGSMGGWKHCLDTYRAVPDNSEIFECCRNGNIDRVRSLLTEGKASVWDRDSDGYTPLHFAAGWWQPEICRELLAAGASKEVMTNPSNGPFPRTALRLIFYRYYLHQTISSEVIKDTTRIFLDQFDFSECLSDGWAILILLLFKPVRVDWSDLTKSREDVSFSDGSIGRRDRLVYDCLEWLLALFRSDIREHFSDLMIQFMLSTAGGYTSVHSPQTLNAMLEAGNNMIDILQGPEGFSALHQRCFSHQDYKGRLFRIRRGADNHIHGYDFCAHGDRETPLSLAMRSSTAYCYWRKALKDANIDILDYVARACQDQPLKGQGWTEASLLALFHFPMDNPTVISSAHIDCGCCGSPTCYPIEPWWQRTLRMIKAGRRVDGKVRDVNVQRRVGDTEISTEKKDRNEWEGVKEGNGEEEDPPRWQDQFDYLCLWCWNERMYDDDGQPRFACLKGNADDGEQEDQDSSEEQDSLFLPPLPFE